MSVSKNLHSFAVVSLVCSSLVGCGGGASTSSDVSQSPSPQEIIIPDQTTKSVTLSGAAVKGPLDHATVTFYSLDTAKPNFYDQNLPLVSTVTNSFGEFSNIEIPASASLPLVMVVNGESAIDVNSGMTPVITVLSNIITDEMLAKAKPVYATPMTTMAFEMARFSAGPSPDKNDFIVALNAAAMTVRETLGLGMSADINILTASPVLNGDTNEATEQKSVAQYRAASEALAAMLHSLSANASVTTPGNADQLMSRVALDLVSDGQIDNSASGEAIGGIDMEVVTRDPNTLLVPNTSVLVKEIGKLLVKENASSSSPNSIQVKDFDALVLRPVSRVEKTEQTAKPTPTPEPTPPTEPSQVLATVLPTSVYPKAGQIEVVANEEITASFRDLSGYSNIEVNSLVLTTDGVSVDGALTTNVAGANFTPSVPLQYNKIYTAEVSASMRQVSTGNVVATKYSWTFTTINPNADWIVFFNDLNDASPKLYTEQDLRNGWNLKGTPVGLKEGRVSVVAGDTGNRSNSLRIRYPARTRGLAGGGVQWRTQLEKHDELYVSYWVKFGAGFDFVRGGKLHGLAGGTANTGGGTNPDAKPTGYDGWSARMMWHGNRPGVPDGAAVQYMYHPDQPNTAGDDFRWDLNGQRYFTPGKWHKVETRIKMNSPGVRNGIVQSWFDGVLALDRRNVRFREVDTFAVDQFLFCTIFGGSDDTWATTKEEFSYFDNFIVSTRPITH